MSVPSEDLIKQAQKEVSVTDKRGRNITLKKYTYLRETQFIRMLGEAAQNDRYINGVLPILYVVSIDDDRILTPNTQRELDAIISRLDEDGMLAISKGIMENFMQSVPVGTARLQALIAEMDANLIADLIEYAEDLLNSYVKPVAKESSVGEDLKKVARDATLKECLWLVKNGVPFDVAFSLGELDRAGWAIAFSEMEGNKFDFNAMEWIDDNA